MGRRSVALLVTVCVVVTLVSVWLLRRETPDERVRFTRATLLDEAIASIAEFYVDSIDEAGLYDLAIDGMLRSIGDPYTDFLRGDDFGSLTQSTTGNYSGLGMRVEASDGWITVVTPIASTPAEEAGVLPGDRIVGVGDLSTEGWSVDEVVSLLRGEVGTSVRLRILRPGMSELLDFQLERAAIHVSAIRYADFVDEGIGYVWLETVSEDSGAELEAAVDELRDRGAQSVILDLRLNPGGLLGQGIAVSDLFLDAGDAVVETRGRSPRSVRTYSAGEPERWAGMALVVLVNEYTASAAEIIAGALQDHDRALIIGSPTFGKGLVQTVFPTGRAEALKLTTGRWFTPIGRSIQRDPILEEDSAGVVPPETFRTLGGRVVRGGGGIYPDVLVLPDTLSTGESAFNRALGGDVQVFRDVMSTYVLDLKGQGALTQEDVGVTSGMRRELRRRLQARDVIIPQRVWDDAGSFIDRQLTYQALRYAFGLEAEVRRRRQDDVVVTRAIELLRAAGSPEELLEVATREP